MEAQLQDLSNRGGAPGLITRFRNATTDDFFSTITEQMDSQTDALSRQVALLNEIDPKERARLQVQQELDASMRELTKLADSLPTSAPAGVLDAIANIRAAAQATSAAKNAAIDRSGITELERITNTIGPSLAGAIAQAGQDGFKSWEGPLQSVAGSLQSALIGSFSQALLFNAFGGAGFGSGFTPLFSFAEGNARVTRPTLAIVGDNPGPDGENILTDTQLRDVVGRGRGGDSYTISIVVNGGDAGSARRFEAAMDRALQRKRGRFRGRLGPGL